MGANLRDIWSGVSSLAGKCDVCGESVQIPRRYGTFNIGGHKVVNTMLGIKVSHIGRRITCDECGLSEIYCSDCKAYHHSDSFRQEHIDFQATSHRGRKK